MSQQRAVPGGATDGATTRQPSTSRNRAARHRTPRRTVPGSVPLVGLAAALAAAVGTVGFGSQIVGSPGSANSTVDLAATSGKVELSALASARIQRRQLASRSAERTNPGRASSDSKQVAANRLAAARAAKLGVYRSQIARRAAALAATKAAAERAHAKAVAAEAARLRAAAAAIKLPVAGYRITAVFGQGGGRWARNHTGTDFAAPTGTRVGALMQGTVVSAGWAGAYGKQIKIRHADGTESWYNHLSKIAVAVGEQVQAGEQIGAVGTTGNSTGPHLHLEIRPGGGGPVNPLRWLREHGMNP